MVIFYEWSPVIVWRERTIAYLYIVYVWRTYLIYRRNTFIGMKNAKICPQIVSYDIKERVMKNVHHNLNNFLFRIVCGIGITLLLYIVAEKCMNIIYRRNPFIWMKIAKNCPKIVSKFEQFKVLTIDNCYYIIDFVADSDTQVSQTSGK